MELTKIRNEALELTFKFTFLYGEINFVDGVQRNSDGDTKYIKYIVDDFDKLDKQYQKFKEEIDELRKYV